MRLRTTAAVLVGALALVLPTAGPSLADDHGDRALGTLNYRFINDDDVEENGQIRPADNHTCYVLTHTSQDRPAVAVRNNTRSRAHLFDNRSCSGEEVATLRPDRQVNRVRVVSVYFTPVNEDDEGRGDWNNGGDQGRGDWNNGGDQGRGDQGREDEAREDQGRGDQGREDEARDDQGRGDQGRDDQAREDEAREDQGREDQGRGDQARDDQGRGDQARDDEEEEEEALLDKVFRTFG
ncbi:hypothetical protein [Streptomyces sp. NRRL F-2580]|uniref:hypothetical protein n=1 Tax=Streptomyces sp. NRRL F-2580 TaxID=1463841 RepID=UPI0004C7006C|nr:hypothetical protein [Streptomyces sp. NRRL F-2580]